VGGFIMQEFIDSVCGSTARKEAEDLKKSLMSDFKALIEYRNALKMKPLSQNELSEAMELEEIFQKINDIAGSKLSTDEKVLKFDDFLKNRWDRIRKTSFHYCYSPTSPITIFCDSLAKTLNLRMVEGHKTDYQRLMYTLKGVTDHVFDQDLDTIPLRNFILDSEGAYPIYMDILPRYFSSKKKEELSADQNLKNPYKKVEGALVKISDEELQSLINFSQEGRDLSKACENYLGILHSKEGDFSIGDALKDLAQGLMAGGESSNISGGGNKSEAGPAANEAISKFRKFIENLPDDELSKQLFNLRSTNYRSSFKDIWESLSKGGVCVEVQGTIVHDIIQNPENSDFLFSTNKATLLKNSESVFNACLRKFEVCLLGGQWAGISFPYGSEEQSLLMTLAQIFECFKNNPKFLENSNIFNAASSFIKEFFEEKLLLLETFNVDKEEASTLIEFMCSIIRLHFDDKIKISDNLLERMLSWVIKENRFDVIQAIEGFNWHEVKYQDATVRNWVQQHITENGSLSFWRANITLEDGFKESESDDFGPMVSGFDDFMGDAPQGSSVVFSEQFAALTSGFERLTFFGVDPKPDGYTFALMSELAEGKFPENNKLYLAVDDENQQLFYKVKGVNEKFEIKAIDANNDNGFIARLVLAVGTGKLDQITDEDRKTLLSITANRGHTQPDHEASTQGGPTPSNGRTGQAGS
jgi:hypothetical protein